MDKKHGILIQFVRHIIQFAAFIFFPGLFIMAFSAVGDMVTALVNGKFSVERLLSQIIIVITIFLITALWGRFFCGFLCSFGMLQEILFFFSKRVISGKIQVPEKFDHAMKFVKYCILAFIVAGVWILALPVDSSFNPWGVFGMLVSGNLSNISTVLPTVGFLLLLIIIIGSFFVERFFCRYLCPLGALFAVVSKKRFFSIRRQSASCTNCGLCVRKCSMGIHIPKKDAVTSGECIDCMKCLNACPKESLSVHPAGAIAGTATATAIGGMVIFGNQLSGSVTEVISEGQFAEKSQKGEFKDGVYTGIGKGFRGNTEVQVTVENGHITDITVLSFEDDKEFFYKAQSAVINTIITEQALDIDTVSGATFSSNSIIDAVASALEVNSEKTEQSDDEKNSYGSEQPGAERHERGRHRRRGKNRMGR